MKNKSNARYSFHGIGSYYFEDVRRYLREAYYKERIYNSHNKYDRYEHPRNTTMNDA